MASVNGNVKSFTYSGVSWTWYAKCTYPAKGDGTAAVNLVVTMPSGYTGHLAINATAYIDGTSVGTLNNSYYSTPCDVQLGTKSVSAGSHSFKITWSGSGISGVNGDSSGSFTVAADTYTVSFNANGGAGAPSSQTATIGNSITIPLQQPTKSNTASSPYVVTFNGNGGVVDENSLTSYNRTGSIFSSWNTNSSGTGTNYAPGAAFSASANTTLYAKWSDTTARDTIIMPSGSRDGYTLLGFGTSASATTYVANPYTPTGNVTLYAIWGTNTETGWNVVHPLVRIKM